MSYCNFVTLMMFLDVLNSRTQSLQLHDTTVAYVSMFANNVSYVMYFIIKHFFYFLFLFAVSLDFNVVSLTDKIGSQ